MKVPVTILQQTERTVAGATWRGNIADPNDPYEGFSVCHYTGDIPERYSACRQQLGAMFGLPPVRVVVPRQVHGTAVAVVTDSDFDRATVEDVDAVVTNVPELIVGVCTADCIPVILTSDSPAWVAAMHAGWRGAVAGIVEKTVKIMRGQGAATINAIVGVGIGCCCFEVGEEVAAEFPGEFVSRQAGEKPHVDLPAYVVSCLHRAGVDSVVSAGQCTRCAPERYFSARAHGVMSGRNYTFAMIK